MTLHSISPIRAALVSTLVAATIFPLGVAAATKPGTKYIRPSLPVFSSCVQLRNRIQAAQKNQSNGPLYMMERSMPLGTTAAPTAVASPQTAGDASSAVPSDFSQTNNQVQNVDEGDIIKTDGAYLYHLARPEGSTVQLTISRTFPADQAALLSQTAMTDIEPTEIYIEGNRLAVIGTKYEAYGGPMPMMRTPIYRPWYRSSITVVQIWNVADRKHPAKLRTIEFDGSASASRLANHRIYVTMNASVPWADSETATLKATSAALVPTLRDSRTKNVTTPFVPCGNVRYFDVQPAQNYLAVASIPINSLGDIKRTVVLGSSETVYATPEHLYVARHDYSTPSVRDSLNPIETERTMIYAFNLQADGGVLLAGKGVVPGSLLNQFSLDESEGYLRVATTRGNVWDQQNPSTNNIYILSSPGMVRRGALEKLAPGEKIYSVRFMGPRGYIVTFKKVDPLFVIDLSKPTKPTVLGKLKIPGFSDYLHPMDATHLIGVGKNAVDAAEGSFAWYQGMKLAVFDVSDVEHPKELWKTEIGDRGTNSPALSDHKAFLYSPTKQLLALPITLAELPDSIKQNLEKQGNEYGDFTYQGAYIYRLTIDKGFELLGRITHHPDNEAFLKSGSYYGSNADDVDRILYADNTLLTVSNSAIQLHHLFDLKSIKEIRYPTP